MVIDNGSADDSVKMVNENFPEVNILELKKNYGFAGGYIRCFTQLKDNHSEFVLLLNNDTEIDSNILSSFIQAKDKYGDNHLYGGKIFYKNNPEKIWYAGGDVNLKYANSFAAQIINLYNVIILIIASMYINNTQFQIFILISNVIIYMFVYNKISNLKEKDF